MLEWRSSTPSVATSVSSTAHPYFNSTRVSFERNAWGVREEDTPHWKSAPSTRALARELLVSEHAAGNKRGQSLAFVRWA